MSGIVFNNERYMLKITIFISIISSLLLIQYDSLYYISLIQFLASCCILYNSTCIVETADNYLVLKIMPNFFNKINPGLLILHISSFGRFIGCSLISIFGLVFHYEYIQNVTFIFIMLIFAILLIIVHYTYSNLRVKAISRIIKKKY